MSDPLVSMILPTYNGSRYIAQAIESCLAQSYPHLEVVVVDDASSDSNPEIIKKFVDSDSRVRYFRHAINRRLPAALNTGFALARGEYLTWMGDDDVYDTGGIGRLVECLRSMPDVDIVYAGYKFIDQDGNFLGYWDARPSEELPYWNVVRLCALYRRHVYEYLRGFDEDFFLVEDHEFVLRAMGKFNFLRLNEHPYCYRLHSESLSSTCTRDVKLAVRRLLLRELNRKDWLRKSRSMAYLRLSRDAVALGERAAGALYFVNAIIQWPPSVLWRITLSAIACLVLGDRCFKYVKSLFMTGAQEV